MGRKYADADIAELQTIVRIAHALRDEVRISLQRGYSPNTTNPLPAIGAISLPSPLPLFPLLLEAGFEHGIATSISEAYQARAQELRRRIRELIVATCREVAELPAAALASSDELMKKVVEICAKRYLYRLEQWKDELIQRFKQAPKVPTTSTPKLSRNFNQEYVPLLEHFFEENPFPTHADKVFLAKKSNMQYRQIHVWFQNRRNRTKKEGKTLRKKPTHEGTMKQSHILYERMRGHMVGSDSFNTSQAVLSERPTQVEIAQDNVHDPFTSTPPAHAYPSRYPPICHYDPFPCKSGPIRFSRPEWRRAPCSKSLHSASTSIDELVQSFSQLNVRGETRSLVQSHAATAAITVIPSPAPHPSLIIRAYHQSTNNLQRHPLVRAPASSSKVFQSLIPSSKPATLVPLAAPPGTSEPPRKRKIVPLPRWSPGRLRNTNRDSTPSDSSSTSSTSPRLFPLDATPSCPSSVSSLSTPSDIASPQELPRMFGSPCRSLFDSPIYFHGLGDMAAVIPSSVS